MSKVKKALDEARDIQARELDLVDKNVVSFDEMPGLRKWHISDFSFLLREKLVGQFDHIW